MNRQDFLKGMVALMAVPFMPEIKAEAKPVFNVKKIQDRIDFLKKYPLTQEEAFYYNGQKYLYHKGMHDTEERFIMEQELQMFKTFRLR